ncbi:MAG: hypothetical protein GX575_07660 [Candidatus Anammoximicrobium sp.]|nr:hypothetical protein [Candidatus Anammoximicrobium sp.]
MKTWHGFLAGAWLVFGSAGLAGAADRTDQASWAETMAAARSDYLKSPEAQRAPTSDSLFKPFDSGPLDGQGPARHVVVNVAGLQELRLIAKCEKGPANCNIWGEPQLIARDGSVTRLTALKPVSVKVGWGQLLVDKNWQDHPLRVGDRTFSFGLWVHADSELRFQLDGRYERFEAWVGEDLDRAAGICRFQVRSAAPPLPSDWADVAAKFSTQAGWLLADAGGDGIASWFGQRKTAQLEREILDAVLNQIAPRDAPFRAEMEALAQADAAPSDPRWLDLYARACRYRQCLALTGPQSRLQPELDALVAAKAPDADPRWSAFRERAVRVLELDDQFATLQFDLRQRDVLSKATGERTWNGDRYVPVERSTAAEIAKQVFHPAALVWPEDRDPADIVVRRTAALLADLKERDAGARLAAFDAPLAKLQRAAADTPVADSAARRALFDETCRLRRQIAFNNPLLDFDQLVFIKRHRAIYQHMCDQFYGICQNPGGGLYVLEDAFGENPTVRDVLADRICETGRLRDQRLRGGSVLRPDLRYDGQQEVSGDDAEGGSFLSPALSPDARQIVFAYVERKGPREQVFHEDPTRGHWDPQRCYHLFKVNVDGSGLQQLTDGTWNDFDPCWLPNGRVAFISERRGGYLRCGRACPLYTLYDMNPDGSEINCLSFHESNEWNPSVSHDGRIVWTRWDYVDRHGVVAHMPWTVTLDGRDPRPIHGNYAARLARPDMELYVRAIPGSAKYVGVAAPHHGQAYGSLIIISPHVADDDSMGPVRRLTPEVGFPESQGGRQVYSTPWPLSENYHLCVYDAAMSGAALRRPGENYGIYLVDAFGNKELVYRDPDIGCMNPIPLRPAQLPAAPALATAPKPAVIGDQGQATMAVVNVYDMRGGWPENTEIKSLRVFQLVPCAVPSGGLRPHETGKRIAEAGDSMMPCRWVLGTVPVEEDGSAHFTVPAYRELFFQALDERGMAVTSMRSATSLRDGEHLVCAGCHEPKSRTAKFVPTAALALQRPPSTPAPDVDGSHPFSYPRLVQPVLDRHCVQCHEENRAKQAPNLGREPIANKFYASYNSLVPYGFTSYGDNYRTRPGQFGARASKLIALLEKGHYDVKLPPEDFHRLVLWIDCCSMFYGVFEREPGEAQLRGEISRAVLE